MYHLKSQRDLKDGVIQGCHCASPSNQVSLSLYLSAWFRPKTLAIVESAWDFVFLASHKSIHLVPCRARCLGKFFSGTQSFWQRLETNRFCSSKKRLDDYWILCHVSPRWLCQMTKRGFFSSCLPRFACRSTRVGPNACTTCPICLAWMILAFLDLRWGSPK